MLNRMFHRRVLTNRELNNLDGFWWSATIRVVENRLFDRAEILDEFDDAINWLRTLRW